jgi:uncharacterized membrane protein YqhA
MLVKVTESQQRLINDIANFKAAKRNMLDIEMSNLVDLVLTAELG